VKRGAKKPVRAILVREPNWVGDNIFTLPAVRELKKRFPAAAISIVTRPGIVPFWQLVPEVDRIFSAPERGGLRDLSGKLRLIRKLRRERFDLAVVFPRSFESALLARLAGARERWGYAEEGRSPLLTRRARCPRGYRHTHRIDYYYRLLDGGRGETPAPREILSIPGALSARAGKLLQEEFGPPDGSPLIGFHPRASHGPAKCWPLEHFQELGGRLARERGARIAVFGTAVENELVERVVAAGGDRVRSYAGKTSLGELAALLAACDVVVANDTGPLHLAAAVGTPVVALFGSSDPAATAPRGERVTVMFRGLSCSPCLRQVCPEDTACLRDISPREVYERVVELLPER